jgi:nucleoid-associated protein YgaU
MDNKSKGIFDSVINAVTNRDEKAALEAAKQHMADLEKQLQANAQRADAAEKKVVELQTELGKAQADLKIAASTMTLLEQRATAAEAKVKAFEDQKLVAQQATYAAQVAQAKVLASYTTTDKDTLSELALKYYGHATPKYWQLIYEANKDAIGPNPNRVRPGTVLNIPVLPDDMKK